MRVNRCARTVRVYWENRWGGFLGQDHKQERLSRHWTGSDGGCSEERGSTSRWARVGLWAQFTPLHPRQEPHPGEDLLRGGGQAERVRLIMIATHPVL